MTRRKKSGNDRQGFRGKRTPGQQFQVRLPYVQLSKLQWQLCEQALLLAEIPLTENPIFTEDVENEERVKLAVQALNSLRKKITWMIAHPGGKALIELHEKILLGAALTIYTFALHSEPQSLQRDVIVQECLNIQGIINR